MTLAEVTYPRSQIIALAPPLRPVEEKEPSFRADVVRVHRNVWSSRKSLVVVSESVVSSWHEHQKEQARD